MLLHLRQQHVGGARQQPGRRRLQGRSGFVLVLAAIASLLCTAWLRARSELPGLGIRKGGFGSRPAPSADGPTAAECERRLTVGTPPHIHPPTAVTKPSLPVMMATPHASRRAPAGTGVPVTGGGGALNCPVARDTRPSGVDGGKAAVLQRDTHPP